MKNCSSTAWQIEHHCPQCGAPVTLEETDRLFSCVYCKVKLYLVTKDYFRYYLSPQSADSQEIIFVPYWRLKGLAFSCKSYEVEQRIIDASYLASGGPLFPASLGFRPQAMKLRFVSPKIVSKFFKTEVSAETVTPIIERQFHTFDSDSATKKSFYSAFVGEVFSLIYAPVFIKGSAFYDAILNRPIASFREGSDEQSISRDQQQNWEVSFLSTLCPHCGWDLTGEKESSVLLCTNCDSAWKASRDTLEKVDFTIVPTRVRNVSYVPFWKMKVSIEGLKLESYADFVRLANLPKAMKEEWEGTTIYFWAPAFKAEPSLFLRLAQQMTICQPQGLGGKRLSRANMYPVTLPVRDAAESIKITCANLAVDKKNVYPKLREITLRLDQSSLVFLPFVEKGLELIQPEMGFCIQRNTLMYGRNL